ncbi:alpha-L-fucosidase-like isoform X2 [Apostichopus japonicus]|uniref:alpha-L-fucosidase-like isoform X2 n=1 Tax=Stichopus japonicus TaxID=307972 RepID=UPI003AB2BF8D
MNDCRSAYHTVQLLLGLGQRNMRFIPGTRTMVRIPIKMIRLGLYALLFLSVTEVIVYISGFKGEAVRYTPNWKSLDSRPIPDWYEDAKFGIFIHWGVYSVPSFGSEWFWWYWQGQHSINYEAFMRSNYRPGFTYTDFAPAFTAEFFNPKHWADIIEASGAKYAVLTSKHHEGYTLWPSKFSWNWNAKDIGPGRDLVGELSRAIRETHVRFGLYFSLFEWFNPLYLVDKKNNFKTTQFVDLVMTPQLSEVVNTYQPEVIWADGDWDAGSEYWNSTHFLAWLYNDSPVKDTVVTNDRWGKEARCTHGGFFTCDDRYNPGHLVKHKWENCMTIDKLSWGYRRDATLKDYFTIEELIKTLMETISCGGNLLMNVGPTHDGRIAPIFEERLRDMGKWLSVNGEAVYSTKPWQHQNDTLTRGVWYTSKTGPSNTYVYATMLKWPKANTLKLMGVKSNKIRQLQMLGYSENVKWVESASGGIVVTLPTFSPAEVPCQWAWVLKFTLPLQ